MEVELDLEQLTLGKLLAALKAVPAQDGKTVRFDFASANPTTFKSWRGVYAQIALGYGLAGYSGETDDKLLSDFIKEVEAAIGSTYSGWKGGDYTMTEDTPVWVDNPGDANHTGIVGVNDQVYTVMLQTWECDV